MSSKIIQVNSAENVVKSGTTILTEEPFVYVLKSKLRTEACDNCLERGKVLKCSECKYVYYCNRYCQKEAWLVHKSECKNLKQIAPRILPDAARLMARIIVKLNRGGDQEKSFYSENKFRKFKDLMSHYSDIKIEQKRMEHFTSLCGVLFEYLQNVTIPNSAELMGIYGRLCINSYNILDPEMISIGTGIYLAASVIDHSCDPNAVAIFKGTTIFIRTIKPLLTLDWEKVFISYIDVLNSPFERQEELQQSYYFLCKCSRCLLEGQNLHMNSIICPNTNCQSPIDLETEQGFEYIEHCAVCNLKIPQDVISKYCSVSEFTQMQLQTMKLASVAYLDVCKVCLNKQDGLFYKMNVLHVKTLDAAFESSIELGQWEDAENFGMKLIDGYRYYYGDVHPMLGLLYLKLGKILVFKNKSSEALKYLKLAEDILHITHGSTHPLCRTQLQPLLTQATLETSVENFNFRENNCS